MFRYLFLKVLDGGINLLESLASAVDFAPRDNRARSATNCKCRTCCTVQLVNVSRACCVCGDEVNEVHDAVGPKERWIE